METQRNSLKCNPPQYAVKHRSDSCCLKRGQLCKTPQKSQWTNNALFFKTWYA